jgi:hypothetical protein
MVSHTYDGVYINYDRERKADMTNKGEWASMSYSPSNDQEPSVEEVQALIKQDHKQAAGVVAAIVVAGAIGFVWVGLHPTSTKIVERPAPVVTVTVHDPAPGWKWVSQALGDALAESEQGLKDNYVKDNQGHRHLREWTACWEHIGPTTTIVCPDGIVITS